MLSIPEKNPVEVRDIDSIEEMHAISDLQVEAWGDAERDVIPLNQLVAASYVGGSLIGAFDGEKLVGFVYGFYGHIGGRVVHHSHMLAVLPVYRNHDLGFRLKAAQREHVLADGVTNQMTWTFDPLQSANAHFNFAKLGVVSDTYKVNVYGEQGTSFLHQNGTDRLFVTWLLDSPRVATLAAKRDLPPIIAGEDPHTLLGNSETCRPERQETVDVDLVSIEIPADINSIERNDRALAIEWREVTRRVFTETLSRGFVVVDYVRKDERTGAYILKKTTLDDI